MDNLVFPELSFPTFDYKINLMDQKPYIFDFIRQKYVVLTPEEWVRQHILHYMMSKGYVKSRISVEYPIKTKVGVKRADIVYTDKLGDIVLLVECKAPDVKINESTLRQAGNYNLSLKVRFLVISNGKQTYIFETDFKKAEILSLFHFPENIL